MIRSDSTDTQVRAGVNRSGRLDRSAEGLTAKVLAERLTKSWTAAPPAMERCGMGRAEVGGRHRLRRPGAGSGGAGAKAPTVAGGAEPEGGESGSPVAGG